MTYEIIQPPFEKNLRDMSRAEAKDYLQWFIGVLPERIAMLESAVRDTDGFESWRADYSPSSLDGLGLWFVSQVETRGRSEEELERIKRKQVFPISVSDSELTNKTFSLAMDIGMYMGQVFVANHPSLKWGQDVSNKKFVDYGQALIEGFGKVPFSPVGTVVVQAYGMADKKISGGRLRELYDIWEKRIQY